MLGVRMSEFLIPEDVRLRFTRIHQGLLVVHKQLLDHERIRYERQHGRIASSGEFLRLAIEDPWFAWLRPLTALITQIDEYMESKEAPPPGAGDALFAECRRLLSPLEDGDPFQHQYFHAIQESPEVASAHGQWRTTLLQLERGS
jgi:hypothetical protein